MAPRKTIDQIIGERIRHVRQAKRLTMDQLAKKIGISFNMIHKVETGQCRMTVARLSKISDALQWSMETFLKGL